MYLTSERGLLKLRAYWPVGLPSDREWNVSEKPQSSMFIAALLDVILAKSRHEDHRQPCFLLVSLPWHHLLFLANSGLTFSSSRHRLEENLSKQLETLKVRRE